MDLDRQSIEKRDFPIGRRGYEPEAVDMHLEAVAREVDALRRQAKARSGESLASMASVQVQAIVEAAESSASDIERQARTEAARIRQEAEQEAQDTRSEAVERATDHVNKVSEATSVMLQRVDAMESELGALFESLRTGANRLTADLSLLEGNMGELYGAAGGSSAADPVRSEPPVSVAAERAGAPEPVAEPPLPQPPADAEPQGDGPETAQAVPAVAAAGGAEREDDVEGARLIALNMALNGQSRDEADRYLAENFDLADRASLLEEVYTSVGG